MSPEVFVRAGYDTSADIWSLACTIFEIATGCLLFKPKKHEKWSKDEDHLKQYTEFIGSGFLIKAWDCNPVIEVRLILFSSSL